MSTDACRCMVCLDYGDRDRLGSVDARLFEHIADPGWGLLAIPEDEVSAGWTFTIGLWHSFRVPELAVFGLEPQPGMGLLNVIGEQVAAGRRPAAGDELDDVLESGRLALRPVDEGWHDVFFGTAQRFYRATHPAVPFLQVLWPDRDGRFPAQDEFAPELALRQPQLWLSPPQHAKGPWTADL
ncbi:DUF4262 domain-containing protein [Amycolatopsis sp. NPDC051373]|uniref:DUF4262 domain-containing protein n=1 Tax=Amycolatopsis sp. NPDC051373 TaxID=3155801 RepID=UPI003450DB47